MKTFVKNLCWEVVDLDGIDAFVSFASSSMKIVLRYRKVASGKTKRDMWGCSCRMFKMKNRGRIYSFSNLYNFLLEYHDVSFQVGGAYFPRLF